MTVALSVVAIVVSAAVIGYCVGALIAHVLDASKTTTEKLGGDDGPLDGVNP